MAVVAVSAAALIVVVGIVSWSVPRPRPAPHSDRGAASRVADLPTNGSVAPYYGDTWLKTHPSPPFPINARGAILVDLGARQVLWSRADADQLPPASLTKMLTAEVALRHEGLDHQIKITDAETHLDPSAQMMGLSAGEVLTVRELLYGVFMLSANDAAEALAEGTEPRDQFIAEMNRTAAGWGLNARFTNPTGLDEGGLHASARDLAVIAGHLMQDDPAVIPIAATKETSLPASPLHKDYDLETVNGLVLHDFPGADGLKTGFTDNAGYCIAATATRNGRHLLAVVMNSNTDLGDAQQLLEYGFSTAPIPT